MNTPRTDALHHQWLAEFPEPLARYITCLGHARQLETELTAAQVRIAELERERVIKQTHIENLNESITDLTAKLAAAEADKPTLACGHDGSLAVLSGETGEFLYCELCDCRDARNDAIAMEQELRAKLAAAEADARRWIPVAERLPDSNIPVIVLWRGEARIGELRWEHPTYEETFRAYAYWDDPHNEGQDWEWEDISAWMPLPAIDLAAQEGK